MQTYRIVLIPKNEEDIKKFYSITAPFRNFTKTYCMGEESSLPHITIAKLYVDETKIIELFKEIKSLKKPYVEIDTIAISHEKGFTAKKANLLVKRKEIIGYHNKICNILDIDNKSNEYTPHITLFDTIAPDSQILKLVGNYAFAFKDEIEYKLAIGTTDAVGQVAKILISED